MVRVKNCIKWPLLGLSLIAISVIIAAIVWFCVGVGVIVGIALIG